MKPRWWILYVIVGLGLALMLREQLAAGLHPPRLLEGLTLIWIFLVVYLWLSVNESKMHLEEHRRERAERKAERFGH